MHELDRRPIAARHPAVAPARQRDHHRVEVPPLLGQPVLEARRPLRVAHPLEDPVLHQLPQPVRQTMARRPEIGLKILEPAHAEERVAEDEERPAIPHDGKGAGDRAGHVADVAPAHARPIGS